MILRVLYILAVGFSILLALDILAIGVQQLRPPLQGLFILGIEPSWIRAALVGFFTGRRLGAALIP